MFGIIKKDWLFYIGYLMLLPLQILYWHTTRMQLDTTVVFMTTGWLYIVTLGVLLGVEMNEMKNRGYSFLSTLPLSSREIVGAKFIPIFLMTAIYVTFTYFAFASLEVSPAYLALSRKWLLFNAAFALLLTGTLYWFVFRFGFEKAVYLQAALFGLAFIVPIGLNELVIRGYLDDTSAIFRLARAAGNGSLLVAGAAVYLFCYYISVRTFERKARA